jgi:hypothetical protein
MLFGRTSSLGVSALARRVSIPELVGLLIAPLVRSRSLANLGASYLVDLGWSHGGIAFATSTSA